MQQNDNQPLSDRIADNAPLLLKHGLHFAIILVGFWLIFSTVPFDPAQYSMPVWVVRAIQNVFHNLRGAIGLAMVIGGIWFNVRLRIKPK